jgi:D-alanyl-lipoteichoic acid acyltransferase DltB (MBOAT superfamily)
VFFDTPIYIVFLTLVVLAYWRLHWRQQNVLLLVASYIFYGWWDPRFLGLIALSTVVDYYCAKIVAASNDDRRRKTALIFSLVINLGFLATFKYFNFFMDSFAATLQALGFHQTPVAVLKILLPPGISFYTFQEVAYIVDVYRKKLKPADSLVDYALFISLFPHLIAGPIQRPGHLLPQVQQPRRFDQEQFFSGLLLILMGLFRKTVIADNCALLADAAFSGRLGEPSVAVVAIGTYAFAWQIYGDFSGYSDIARGSAQLLGFHFMVNFRQPYLATSLQDFWRRWHISLSTWLRDYLYIPLGGNRHGERKTYRNLLLTMIIGGFWHGANWTFLVWGAIHGVGLSIERLARRALGREPRPAPALAPAAAATAPMSFATTWAWRVVIFHLVCLAWVFFRAPSIQEAMTFLAGLGSWHWIPAYGVALRFLFVFTAPLLLIDLFNEYRDEEYLFERALDMPRVAIGVATMACVALFAANQINAFIYFQF